MRNPSRLLFLQIPTPGAAAMAKLLVSPPVGMSFRGVALAPRGSSLMPLRRRGTSAFARGRLAVHRASPYRIQPSSAEPEACARPAARARVSPSRAPWAASFAAHTAVLGALALAQTPLNATVPLDPNEPPSDDRELYVHAEESRPAFPSSWADTWFDGIGPLVPEPPPCDDPDLPMSEALECLSGAQEGWARIDVHDLAMSDHESASRRVGAAALWCADYAAREGWRGRGRVFVRVDRREDGAAIATTTPLGDDARHDALLCCLRQAQTPVASMLRPGGAVRFVLVFGADPGQRHLSVEHTVASRRHGGPEARALVQSTFRK